MNRPKATAAAAVEAMAQSPSLTQVQSDLNLGLFALPYRAENIKCNPSLDLCLNLDFATRTFEHKLS